MVALRACRFILKQTGTEIFLRYGLDIVEFSCTDFFQCIMSGCIPFYSLDIVRVSIKEYAVVNPQDRIRQYTVRRSYDCFFSHVRKLQLYLPANQT